MRQEAIRARCVYRRFYLCSVTFLLAVSATGLERAAPADNSCTVRELSFLLSDDLSFL